MVMDLGLMTKYSAFCCPSCPLSAIRVRASASTLHRIYGCTSAYHSLGLWCAMLTTGVHCIGSAVSPAVAKPGLRSVCVAHVTHL
jgi:hypothetical protein